MGLIADHEDIPKERQCILKGGEIKDGNYILYWMQRAQRSEFNHALEYAVDKANSLEIPLVVLFCLTEDFKDANLRHYHFMIEGLNEVKHELEDRDIILVVKHSDPVNTVVDMSKESSITVVDKAYLAHTRNWRQEITKKIDVPVIEVDTDLVIPVEETSDKEEYAARTIRPKIQNLLKKYLKPVKERNVTQSSLDLSFDCIDMEKALDSLEIDASVKPVAEGIGGSSKAKKQLDYFVKNKLEDYPECSNDPSKDGLSNMSPYLHFGQISPIYIALEVKNKGGEGVEGFLEQLIVRRELAFNFVYYNEDYENINCLPGWARETLEKHKNDEREYIYSRKELEEARTHDEYWNAAQKEMLKTGKMHGYMRMYWGKKILEWSETPEEAYHTSLYLNNKYELDGRDPNGYAGVAWCFGKHDQAWKERKIYGKVRYMNANGLKRKFDIERYVRKIEGS